jgi:hypothetical protein
MGFIDTMRAEGHSVESICRVLREQGCQIVARTYRPWKQTSRVIAARTVSDAHVVDAVRDIAWTTDRHGRRKLAPEGLYGRRKMTAYLRRVSMPAASAGSVDRAMRSLDLVGVRRDKGIQTTIPAKDGIRAGDLLDRNFTASAPNLVWVPRTAILAMAFAGCARTSARRWRPHEMKRSRQALVDIDRSTSTAVTRSRTPDEEPRVPRTVSPLRWGR